MGEKEAFDVGSLLTELDKEFEETAVPETQGDDEPVEEPTEEVAEEVAEDTPQEDEEPVEELEVEGEEPETKPEPTPTDVNDPDIHKRNEAFKKLREEKQKLEESDKLLGELATQYGITKEELISKFKEDRINPFIAVIICVQFMYSDFFTFVFIVLFLKTIYL